MQKYDVIVIGAGPAGYVAAIRCAQLGLNVACIDEWLNKEGKPSLGGTCLNVGCIPSKALLESSELYEKACVQFEEHGINAKDIALDLQKMLNRKDQIVRDSTSGIGALFEVSGITLLSGHGKLLKEKQVEVTLSDGGDKQLITAKYIILATGSQPKEHPKIPFTKDYIVDSTEALEFDSVPKSIAVLGAGIVGLELGSVWRRLDSKVSLFKSSATLLPATDEQIANQAAVLFKKQGLNFCFSTTITGYEIKNKKVCISYEDEKGRHEEQFDKVIVAIGRQPNVKNAFEHNIGINVNEQGFIEVNEQCETNISSIYAIGDVVRGPMLAHKGSEEGMMVAELIAGKYARVNYETVPFVVYTEPEIAWCGQTEEVLKEAGMRIMRVFFLLLAMVEREQRGKLTA